MRPEYRKSARRYVRTGARMAGADGSALGRCLILDLSGTGARLETNASKALPDEFILLLSHDGRLHRKCAVAWRSETAIGVRFLRGRPAKQK
jgi:hypothetical protein